MTLLGGCRPAMVERHHEAALSGGFLELHVETPPTTAPPYPAVIALTGEREALLHAGFAVVTFRLRWEQLRGPAPPPDPIPAVPGGARSGSVGVWLLASPSPRTVGQRYFGLIAAQVAAVSKVVEHLATLPDIDAGRVGITGSSTNGFVALEATAAEPRLVATVAVASCGDYHRFLELSSLAMNGAALDLDPAYARGLRAREPASHPERLLHAAVLMVNGSADVAVPAACASETAAVLGAAYERAGAPERFALLLVEGAGHTQLGPQARDESLAWFGRWLRPASR